MENALLKYLLIEPEKKYGKNHVISIYDNDEFTYGYYHRSIDQYSEEFTKINVKNEAVIIFMDDCPDCISLFLALIKIGAKPLIVSTKTSLQVLKGIITISKTRVVIKSEMISLPKTICNGNLNILNVTKGKIRFVGQLNGSFEGMMEDICYLALTSGTSGIPKLVKHSANEMKSAIEHYGKNTLSICDSDILFSIAKINFTYGLANNLFFSFASGAKAILYDESLNNKEIIRIINDNGVTCFFAVPSLYMRLTEDVNTQNTDSIRLFVSAGDYLPGDITEKWMKKTGRIIVDSAGCSETGSAYLVNLGGESKNGSAGRVVEGYEVDLLGDETNIGEMVVGGPSIALGYLNDEINTRKKFKDGKIFTGDIFRRDSDAYYWFVGRTDDLIKKKGRWVSLNEISGYLRKIKGVLNAVCLKVTDEVCAVIEIDDNFEGIEKLENDIREDMDHYKIPDSIHIGVIPLNNNGKVDYLALQVSLKR